MALFIFPSHLSCEKLGVQHMIVVCNVGLCGSSGCCVSAREALQKKAYLEGFFFSICGGFYPPLNKFRGFFKPPQFESPQTICGGFFRPLVSYSICGSFSAEYKNLLYIFNLRGVFCGG
ncbi:hypothetical protein V8G54_036703 [Vigna mungo]|uniref:Uncharacterized protein n=1 Tax=Vigna mungo TaxID=3915 RepID=A0AAQ3MHQ4_VIGMU